MNKTEHDILTQAFQGNLVFVAESELRRLKAARALASTSAVMLVQLDFVGGPAYQVLPGSPIKCVITS